MEQRSNPWGIAPTERTKWCCHPGRQAVRAGRDRVPLLRRLRRRLRLPAEARHRGPGHHPRRRRRLLGDSRQGREMLRRQPAPARQRVSSSTRWPRRTSQLFKEKGVTKVITQCPHCFSTLKNDYRQYGLELEVIHHSRAASTQLLAERQAEAEQAGDRAGQHRLPRLLLPGAPQRRLRRAPRGVIAGRHRQSPG